MLAQVPLSVAGRRRRRRTAALDALPSWRGTPVPRRARILFRYQQLLVEHWDELATLDRAENGKSYKDAYGEVQRGIECVEFAAGAPTLLMGDNCPTSRRSGVGRVPLSGRRGGRHHAVQLSDDGPVLDVSARDRLRQHIRSEAFRADAAVAPTVGRAVRGGGPAGRRASTSCTAPKMSVNGLLEHPTVRGHLVRRLAAGGGVRVPRTRQPTASACRRWPAPRTTPS